MSMPSVSLADWNERGKPADFQLEDSSLSKDNNSKKKNSKFSGLHIWIQKIFRDINLRVVIITCIINSFISILMFLSIYSLRTAITKKFF